MNHRVMVLFVDEQDREFALSSKWTFGQRGYIRRYKDRSKGNEMEFLHRLIMQPPDGMVVDHINGLTWDNRRRNLRVVTQLENAQNRKGPNKGGSSGFLNVHRTNESRHKPWEVICRKNRVRYRLGYFATAEVANVVACKWRAENRPMSRDARGVD